MSVAVAAEFAARIRRNEPMSQHTSWRVGGPADVFFTPRDRADLAAFLRQLPAGHAAPVGGPGQQPAGARWRHPRRGHLHATEPSRASSTAAPQLVYCEAGVPCPRVTRQCASWGLGHAEFFAGIPGTMGGALAMNAGRLRRRDLELRARRSMSWSATAPAARARRASTRSATGTCGAPANDEWFLAAELEFTPPIRRPPAKCGALAQRRKLTQPLGEWSCGSVFTNPPGDHAARLIEAAGPQGLPHRRRGGLREARQLHPQRRRRHGARPRGADRARARDRAARARHRPGARSAHRRGEPPDAPAP